MKAIINARLYDYQEYIEKGFICYDEHIESVGHMDAFQGAEEVWDAAGKLIMPGLINFHTHAYSVFARGFDFNASPETFTEILEQIWWRMDRVLSLEDVYASALLYAGESIKKGVLGIVDHHASGAILGSVAAVNKGFKTAGIYGISCFETSDRFDIDSCIQENSDAYSQGNRLFGMHASMTLSDETLERIQSSIGAAPIHVHVSESIDDQQKYTLTPLERLNQFGVLKEGSLVVHGVHMTRSDLMLLKNNKAILALAPRSNLNNAVGIARMDKVIEMEIPFVAGTDGLGVDVADSWKWIYYLANNQKGHLELNQLRMAIVESYKYYQRISGRETGRFQVGKKADFIAIDYRPFTPISESNAFSHVFYGVFDSMDVRDAWFGGEKVLSDGELCIDTMPDKKAAMKIWDKIGGGFHE